MEGVYYMRNGIVTIFSAPHLSSAFQRGGDGGGGGRRRKKEKNWRGLRKCIMRIWGCFFFFFWLYGNRGKGGMRMVYTEFLYSFIRDFLTINGVENNKLSVSWVYLLIRKSQPCAKEHREISGPRRSYYRNHQPLRSICMCCHYMLAQQHVKKKKKKKQRRLLCIERNLFLQVEIFSSIFIPPQCLAVGENTVK